MCGSVGRSSGRSQPQSVIVRARASESSPSRWKCRRARPPAKTRPPRRGGPGRRAAARSTGQIDRSHSGGARLGVRRIDGLDVATEVLKNPRDDRGCLDAGDDAQAAAALLAGRDLDGECSSSRARNRGSPRIGSRRDRPAAGSASRPCRRSASRECDRATAPQVPFQRTHKLCSILCGGSHTWLPICRSIPNSSSGR